MALITTVPFEDRPPRLRRPNPQRTHNQHFLEPLLQTLSNLNLPSLLPIGHPPTQHIGNNLPGIIHASIDSLGVMVLHLPAICPSPPLPIRHAEFVVTPRHPVLVAPHLFLVVPGREKDVTGQVLDLGEGDRRGGFGVAGTQLDHGLVGQDCAFPVVDARPGGRAEVQLDVEPGCGIVHVVGLHCGGGRGHVRSGRLLVLFIVRLLLPLSGGRLIRAMWWWWWWLVGH